MASMRSFRPLNCARICAEEFGALLAGRVGSKGMAVEDLEKRGLGDEECFSRCELESWSRGDWRDFFVCTDLGRGVISSQPVAYVCHPLILPS
jgi:hypothetical protein